MLLIIVLSVSCHCLLNFEFIKQQLYNINKNEEKSLDQDLRRKPLWQPSLFNHPPWRSSIRRTATTSAHPLKNPHPRGQRGHPLQLPHLHHQQSYSHQQVPPAVAAAS
ncbi:hypothetical protein FGO68_gene17278 [Halteria grandinella]|uniref:Uncharacterized protein n=1 Tax=Halteria grandinella TaxID=5974 RepID=A0A8J8NWW9_HALGN|nr:hypothetical protein FGO68_gene17278 [Halteria grandinella]